MFNNNRLHLPPVHFFRFRGICAQEMSLCYAHKLEENVGSASWEEFRVSASFVKGNVGKNRSGQ